MKTKFCTLSIIFFLIQAALFAQENTLKTGFTDASLGHFNLSFERVVNDKNSVQLKIGYWQPTLSPFISEKTITPEAYVLQESNGGIDISFEYRFYVSKKAAPNGLYLAPYLRYFNQNALYSDEIDKNLFNVDTKLNTVGIGAQLGYQVIINELLTLDFYFFGAGVDNHYLKLIYQLKQPQSGFDYNSITDDVSKVFKDINYLEKRLKHNVQPDRLVSKLPFLFPGFRIGASLGIAF